MNLYNQLIANLQAYKRKYYKNLLLKGGLLTTALVLSAFTAVNLLEYFGNFDTTLRAALFYGFLATALLSLVVWVANPSLKLLQLNKPLSNEEAALQLGKYFPEIQDKLLNVLQLANENNQQSALLMASIQQKSQKLTLVNFLEAVKYEDNRRYLAYLVPPVALVGVILLFVPNFFAETTPRLIRYNEKFVPKAPFNFNIKNTDLQVFRNEDFEFVTELSGEALPKEVFMVLDNGRKLKMDAQDAANFAFLFKNVQKEQSFYIEAAGFQSVPYTLKVVDRPNLANFSAQLNYPAYIQKANEKLENTGNLMVPEGTSITWLFKAQQTDGVTVQLGEEVLTAQKADQNLYELTKKVLQTTTYKVQLKNQFSTNKEPIEYQLTVIPDEYPSISLKQYEDTTLYNYLLVGGNIGDDYGIRKLELGYRILTPNTTDNQAVDYKYLAIPFNTSLINQSYYHQLNLADFNLSNGQKLEYFVQVWDNDGIKGSKSSRTGVFEFKIPDKNTIKKDMAQSARNTESQIEKTLDKAKDLEKSMKDVEDRLKSKRSLSWQDKKAMEEMLNKQKELEQAVQEMQRQNQQLQQKQDRFNQQNQEITEKTKQLQELMDKLLDPETKKLMDEMQKLLQQENNQQNMQDKMDEMEKKNYNLKKELDRTLELFKKLQLEMKMKESMAELKQLAEKQEDLAKETEKQADQKPNDKTADKNDKADTKDKDNKDKGDKADKNDKTDKSDKADKTDKGEKTDQKDKNDKADKANAEKQPQDPKNQQPNSEKNDKAQENLEKKQEELNKEFQDLKKQFEEMEKLNEEMKNSPQKEEMSEKLDEMKPDQKDVEQEQQKSSEQLQKKQNKDASKSQKSAAEKMKKMTQQMEEMQQNSEMEQAQEDYDDLRQILENLLKLSFSQEDLMKQYRQISQADPRFIGLGQQQLKLKDDAKIIEDSLMALAKRVFQIKSFVTREVTNMNDYMNQSLDEIKKRNIGVAVGKQQFAMTAMNNLALMLSDVLDNMQENLSKGMGGQQMKQKKKPKPNLSQMQQGLNQKMQELMKSGKSGKQLSEELAKMAAEQEQIRRALQQQMGKGSMGSQKGSDKNGQTPNQQGQEGQQGDNGTKGDKGNISKMLEQMEKTEEDLVNKRLTQELIQRQKEILTRLLESEKAQRERDEDPNREAKTASEKQRTVPPAFEEYLKMKEKQIELLKTIPPSFNPYYKQKVNEYFKKLG